VNSLSFTKHEDILYRMFEPFIAQSDESNTNRTMFEPFIAQSDESNTNRTLTDN
jgi:hypothetical protein